MNSDLYNQLVGGDSLEIDTKVGVSSNAALGAQLQGIIGNPQFKAEISFNIITKYYSQAVVGTPVEVAAAAIPAAQKTKLPCYLFGYNDFAGGYRASKNTVGANGWNLADSKLFRVGMEGDPSIKPLPHAAASVDYALGSVFNNVAETGDLVLAIPMNGFVAGAAATTVIAEIIIKCPNVAYTSLLSSLASDTFLINMIRYTVDPALLTQLQNQISIISQSIFGKTSKDTLDPNTYITGQTYNKNIADIPLALVVNKFIGLAIPINYDSVAISWTLTIQKIDKFRG